MGTFYELEDRQEFDEDMNDVLLFEDQKAGVNAFFEFSCRN